MTRRGKPLPSQESLDIELAEEKPAKRSIITVEELTEIERLEDLDTCMVRHLLPLSRSRHSCSFKLLLVVTEKIELVNMDGV